jgi:hypothetical protein
VIRLVDLAEYKRRQSPPGLKITPRAFGRDRRLPIVNAYRDHAVSVPQRTAVEESPLPTPSEGQEGIGAVVSTGGAR